MNNELDKSLIKSSLNPAYRMSNYVQTDYHVLAYQCAEDIIKEPGTNPMNPWILIGRKGAGKTHIIQAIGNEILEMKQNAKVLYLTASDFENLYLDAVKKNQLHAFKKHCYSLDVLIVDDLQNITCQETLEMLLKVKKNLIKKRKQLIFATDSYDIIPAFPEQRLFTNKNCFGCWFDDWSVWDVRQIIDNLSEDMPDKYKDFLARIMIDDIGALKEALSVINAIPNPDYEAMVNSITARFLSSRG